MLIGPKKSLFPLTLGGEERVIGRQNIVSFQKCLPRLSGQGSDLNSACQKMAI
jgi:hypothetical protein